MITLSFSQVFFSPRPNQAQKWRFWPLYARLWPDDEFYSHGLIDSSDWTEMVAHSRRETQIVSLSLPQMMVEANLLVSDVLKAPTQSLFSDPLGNLFFLLEKRDNPW
mmetsp:Transcript_11120/g.12191  ORF Transcript_11120/g.12191 Transcript_11120/m.12191 type:complete len:107 (+) Transcript_11120:428-748(+)